MADLKISQLTGATTPLAGTEVLPVVQGGVTKQVSVANLTAGRAVSALSLSVTQGLTGGSGFQIQGFSSYRASGASASSPGDASMYYNATTGHTFQARAGSSYDWSLINPGNANYILRVPTGTVNMEMAGGNLAFGTAARGVNFTANTPAAGMTSQLLNWYEEGTWTPTVQFGTGNTGMTVTTSGRYTRVGRVVTVNVNIAFTAKGSSTGNFRFNLPFAAGAKASGSMGFNFSWATMPTGGITFMADGGYVYGMPANIGGYIDDTYFNNGTTIEAITISYTV